MKNLKFTLNSAGEFQPAHPRAKLGHPIYQVIGIPDGTDPHQVRSLFNSSILKGTGVVYCYADLGIGKIVASADAPAEPKYELCEPTPAAVAMIETAAQEHQAELARRHKVTVFNIDMLLLKKQKEYLVSISSKRAKHIPEAELDALDGIINLLDAIQDQAEPMESDDDREHAQNSREG